MKKEYLQSWFVFTLVLIVLSACSSEEEKYTEDARVYISSATYDNERDVYEIEYHSNLDFNLVYTATLYNSENQVIGEKNVVIEKKEKPGWRVDTINFEPTDNAKENFFSEDVYLELVIEVDNVSKNKELIYEPDHSDTVVGDAEKLIEHYKGSEDVIITAESTFEYTIILKSKLETVKVPDLIDSPKEIDAATTSYSNEFLDYNEKYYKNFKNQLELVAYNFEILAMDGFANQNIVDDLITWTSEFNELLDVYEVNAVLVNEADQKLHDHTIEMIGEQRTVNKNILDGLTLYDGTYFITTGDHLDSVVDMYVEGSNLLTE